MLNVTGHRGEAAWDVRLDRESHVYRPKMQDA